MGKDLRGKELGVGISQRKDGLYTARFTAKSGKRKQKYFHKLQECRNWLADAQFEDAHSIDALFFKDMTVNEWFEYWFNEIKGNNIRENSKICYRNRYRKNIKGYIGDMLLTEVMPLHCQNILNKMSSSCAEATIAKTRLVMYMLFDSALENELIKSNPVKRSVKSKSEVKQKPRRVLTKREQEAFMNVIQGSTYYNQYAFILQTGLRVGELNALRWSDVDLEKRMIHISQTIACEGKEKCLIGETKTISGKRDIPLTQEAVRILIKQKEILSHLKVIPIEFADYVFINSNGRPTTRATYNKALKRIAEKAEIEHLSMHTLRHTFATRCIEAGMRPKTLQMILGHAKINTTMEIYVHVTYDEKEKELRNVERMLKMV